MAKELKTITGRKASAQLLVSEYYAGIDPKDLCARETCGQPAESHILRFGKTGILEQFCVSGCKAYLPRKRRGFRF